MERSPELPSSAVDSFEDCVRHMKSVIGIVKELSLEKFFNADSPVARLTLKTPTACSFCSSESIPDSSSITMGLGLPLASLTLLQADRADSLAICCACALSSPNCISTSSASSFAATVMPPRDACLQAINLATLHTLVPLQ